MPEPLADLLARATPRPWRVERDLNDAPYVEGDKRGIDPRPEDAADAELIARMVNAAPVVQEAAHALHVIAMHGCDADSALDPPAVARLARRLRSALDGEAGS